MIKIKVSYESDCELREFMRLLSPALVECKLPKKTQGKYKKAYITVVNYDKQIWSVEQRFYNEQRVNSENGVALVAKCFILHCKTYGPKYILNDSQNDSGNNEKINAN